MKEPTVVIINPDWRMLDEIRRVFEKQGYVTWTCPSPDLALTIFSTIRPDLLIVDLEEKNSEVQSMVTACREMSPQTKVVFRKLNAA